jgi:hypothetical protein
MATTQFGIRGGHVKAADTGARKVASTFGKEAHLTLPGKQSSSSCVVESAGERLATNAFALDPTVLAYHSQPYSVDLVDRVLLRSPEERRAAHAKHAINGVEPCFYTPDFNLEWTHGTRCGVEIKVEGYTGDALYQEKLDDAKVVLWAHGVEFLQLVIPSYWRHPLRTNLPLLHQAKLRQDLAPSAATMDKVERLAAAGASTLYDYCSGLGFDTRMAPVLITFGLLSVDVVSSPLSNNTIAAPAFGTLDHLSIVRRLIQ